MSQDTSRNTGQRGGWLSDWGGRFAIAYSALLVFHLLYVTFHWGGDEWASLISNIIAPAIYSGPGILAWRVSRDELLSVRKRRAWKLISLAYFSFMTGEVIWLVLENGLGLTPFPSVADFCYLIFYPLLMCGLLFLVDRFRSIEEMANFWLDSSIVLIAGSMALWHFLLSPMVDAADGDSIKTILSIAYPIGDLVLLLGISSLMMRRLGSTATAPLNLLLAGVIVNFAADFAFGYQSLHGTYVTGNPVDALFTLSCFPVMLGAHLQKLSLEKLIQPSRRKIQQTSRHYWLPYAGVAVVYLVILTAVLEKPSSTLDILILVGGLVTIQVIVRQFLYVRENARASSALSILQHRVQGIFSASSDAIGLAEFDGTLIEVNSSFVRLTGFEKAEIIGSLRYQDFVHEELLDVSVMPESQQESLLSGEHERELVRKDGTKRSVTTTVFTVADDTGEPAALAVVIRDITVRRALEQQLSHQARHDSLTGLANRAMLQERVSAGLNRARRKNSRAAVMFIDLDNFKIVNDTMGHAAGDELLINVANRLRAVLRSSDTPARLGGDEFAILLEDFTHSDETRVIAQRLLDEIRRPIRISRKEVFVGASIGIAIADPTESPDDVLRNADVAMYTAKKEGKNQYALFESSMHELLVSRASLETELRAAVENKEFEVKYQPIVNLDTGRPVGVEALLRWNHPRGLQISPDEFIPIAEETGLISEMGRFVIDKATAAAGRWNKETCLDGPVSVSINISSRQLSDKGLVEVVSYACLNAGLAPSQLILEITESAMLSDTDATVDKLCELRKLGVRLAIDDFGTGYSSLSYLHRFPIDILKIDGSFVKKIAEDNKGAGMARAIISMGETLGLSTIGEGVETNGQADKLKEMGCRLGQGYLFSAALTECELAEYLQNGGSSPASLLPIIHPAQSFLDLRQLRTC